MLKQTETNYRQAANDKNRMQELFDSKSISKKQLEDFLTKYEISLAQYNSAKENLIKMKNLARPEEIKQAEAKYKQSLATEELIKKNIRDSYVISPIDGIIVKKYIEEGENVGVMSSLLKISDLSIVELTIYVSEEQLGKVKLGQKAEISVDAFSNQAFNGTVIFISPESEFTPKNIQTKDERTKQVFGVKIKIPNPNYDLKTGMPADAKLKFNITRMIMLSEVNDIVIHVNNLKKYFENSNAVDDISFEVGKGEMFGFVGPDGAGKTTTIRCLCGLLSADEGSIQILNSDIKRNKKEIQNNIGYLSQKFSLYGDLSVDENIEFFAEIHNVRNYKERRNELLDFTRLTPFRKRFADKLSGGMKQKLALACSLIHKPEIIFLDEPTTGVDPVSRRDFWKILSDLQKDGVTIFMSTPYLDEAERCNRVALIDNGKIISLDTPQIIKDSIGKKVIEIVTVNARNAYKIIKSNSDYEVQLFGDRINIIAENSNEELEKILKLLNENNIVLEDYRITEPSLENVFMNLISRSS